MFVSGTEITDTFTPAVFLVLKLLGPFAAAGGYIAPAV